MSLDTLSLYIDQEKSLYWKSVFLIRYMYLEIEVIHKSLKSVFVNCIFFGKLVSEIIYFSSFFWYSREIWKCICMYMKLLCYSERHFTSQGSRQFFVWIPKSIECYFFTLKRQKRIWIKRLCQEKSRQCVSLIISYILSFIVNYKRGPSCLKAG